MLQLVIDGPSTNTALVGEDVLRTACINEFYPELLLKKPGEEHLGEQATSFYNDLHLFLLL